MCARMQYIQRNGCVWQKHLVGEGKLAANKEAHLAEQPAQARRRCPATLLRLFIALLTLLIQGMVKNVREYEVYYYLTFERYYNDYIVLHIRTSTAVVSRVWRIITLPRNTRLRRI